MTASDRLPASETVRSWNPLPGWFACSAEDGQEQAWEYRPLDQPSGLRVAVTGRGRQGCVRGYDAAQRLVCEQSGARNEDVLAVMQQVERSARA